MARLFASGDSITLAAGSLAGADRAGTIVALIKVPATNALGNAGVIQGTASGTRVWSMLLDTFTPFGNSDFGNGGPDVSGDTWTVVAMSKGSGSEPYRWHLAPVSTGVWVHQDDTSNVADGSGGTDQIQFGVAENTGGIVIAALACYSGELSDVEIEALGVTSMNDWLDGDPLAAWQLNQAATTDDVLDLTGGGADQTAITGTTITDDPPGWAYSSGDHEGTAAAALTLTIATSGSRPSSGTAAFSLNLAAAAAGARPSSGSTAIGLNLTIAIALPVPGTLTASGAPASDLTAAGTTPTLAAAGTAAATLTAS